MKLLLKIAALLGASVMLMGSKLIIQVPAGGSVVSSSGLIACSAGETCTVEMNEQHFAEAFTAVAEPGYQFAGWSNKAGAVCRGELSALCAELDNSAFSDFAGATAIGSRGTGLALIPLFESARGAAQALASKFRVSSLYQTRYYEISGNSQTELWSQLTGAGNPLSRDASSGSKPLAHANFEYRYDYQPEYAGSADTCRVQSAAVTFRFETVLPQLVEAGDSNAQLRDRWLPFQAVITEHEAGHHAIYRQLVTDIPQLLADMGEAPCAALDARVSAAVAQAVAAVRQESLQYDAEHRTTGHLTASL